MDRTSVRGKIEKQRKTSLIPTGRNRDRAAERPLFRPNDIDTRKSIELSDIFFLLRKRKLVLFALFLVFTAAGYFFTKITYIPTYYATSSLVVNANYRTEEEMRVTPVEINLAVSLVPTYTQILKSNRVMDYVIERLDLDLPVNILRSYVSLKHVEDTSILHLTVTCPDPQLAIDISNAIAEVAPKAFQETIEIGSVKILDAAFISGVVPDSAPVISLIAGFAGIVLAFVVFLVLDMLNPMIKYAADIESMLGLPVLGEIEHVKKRKARKGLLLYDGGATSKFIEANMTLGLVINHLIDSRNIKKILVTATSANEGKTLLTVNLGISLAYLGKKVLLVDCDLRKPDLNKVLDIESDSVSTFYGYEDCEERQKCISEIIVNLHVLPFIDDLGRGHAFFQSGGFIEAVKDLESEYDVIIFDSAPIYDVTDSLNLVGICDSVLLTVRQDHTLIREHRKSVEKLSKVGAMLMGTVLNGVKHSIRKSKYLNKYSYRYYYNKPGAETNPGVLKGKISHSKAEAK